MPREKFCGCPLPCPCNVPFEGRGTRCPECVSGNHMDRNGVRAAKRIGIDTERSANVAIKATEVPEEADRD